MGNHLLFHSDIPLSLVRTVDSTRCFSSLVGLLLQIQILEIIVAIDRFSLGALVCLLDILAPGDL
jgi:hypothetical protein